MDKHVVKFTQTCIVLDSAKSTESKFVPAEESKERHYNLKSFFKNNTSFSAVKAFNKVS